MGNKKLTLLWLQSGGCGGCSLSLLNTESPDLLTTLEVANIDLLWHPMLSANSPAQYHQLVKDILDDELELDIFCLEGSVLLGPGRNGIYHRQSGSGIAMSELIAKLAAKANHVIAVGNCAAFGGITAGGNNPANASGLQYRAETNGGLLPQSFCAKSGLPVINISGCPIHPNWVTETLIQISEGEFDRNDIDSYGRPNSYVNHLVHHGCPRNEYYEFKASARSPSQLGCMMEHLGCLGTQAQADCNNRLWNGEGSCVRGGYACINCTAPGFEEPGHTFTMTPKIAGIPVGLPTDMPKAWFVALASLAKAATPDRLKKNAVSDHICIPPVKKKRSRR
jgi:ferredoxin hydrogenase small subunit